MLSNILFYLEPVFVSLILTFLFTWLIRKIAIKYKILDKPTDSRKVHVKPMPLLGGIGIFLSLIITMLAFWSRLHDGIIVQKNLWGILLGGLILIVGGYLDDRYNLKPKYQILFPIIASILVVVSGIGIKYITNPFGGLIYFNQYEVLLFWWQGIAYKFTILADIFTFIWLLGMIYVTKLLDGLDGLASGIGIIGSFIIFGVSLFWDVTQSATSQLALIFAGALIGFLIWNWHPAKIFLGEGGSTLIGFMLGILAIISGGKIATALLIMGIPILDVVWVIGRRIFWEKKSMASSDRKHLHYRLLDIGLSHRQAVVLLYVLTAGFGLFSIFLKTYGKLVVLAIMVLFMGILAYYLVIRFKKTNIN